MRSNVKMPRSFRGTGVPPALHQEVKPRISRIKEYLSASSAKSAVASFVFALVLASSSFAQTTEPTTAAAQTIPEAISRGVKFLEQSQNKDGSWGTGTETRGTEVMASIPGSHDGFRIGTTALALMALREVGEKPAHDRALQYLLTEPDARRADGELLYNTWAHIYVVQALAEEMKDGHNHDPRLAEVAQRNIKHLVEYATYLGGWNYYDFHLHSQSPSLGPTSFGTAAGLVALREARDAGLDVSQRLVDLSLHRLEEMRLSDSAFLYGTDYHYIPRLPANRTRGSIGRTQPANFAIWLWDKPKVPPERIRAGLDAFFADHIYLDMGRKRPWPHESWYQTSGYYYYFDHYYAARLIHVLPPDQQATCLKKLVSVVLPHQEPDGSWWDYAMWDYHKPYGTSFAIMTLLRCE